LFIDCHFVERAGMLELTKESATPDENEATQKIIALLKRRLEREYPAPQRTLRDAHPKQHGLARAHFVVEPGLSAEARVGIFKEVRSFQAWIRFSNLSDPPGADINPDSRGVAIKLMEVAGEKLLPEEKHATTQDFVLMSTDFFVTKDIAEFARLIEALEGGSLRLTAQLLTHPRLLWLFRKARRPCASLFDISYGSASPYLLGARAVKYAVRPEAPTGDAIPESASDNNLREAMVRQLSHREVRLSFLIQFQTDAVMMPIEDPRVVWSEKVSPFIKVATIVIPVQEFDTPAQQEYGDNLSFNPWHSLPEHRPLGSINRGRRIIYETMSKYRHERNGAPRTEPGGWVSF
jgi:hypothetical protein